MGRGTGLQPPCIQGRKPKPQAHSLITQRAGQLFPGARPLPLPARSPERRLRLLGVEAAWAPPGSWPRSLTAGRKHMTTCPGPRGNAGPERTASESCFARFSPPLCVLCFHRTKGGSRGAARPGSDRWERRAELRGVPMDPLPPPLSPRRCRWTFHVTGRGALAQGPWDRPAQAAPGRRCVLLSAGPLALGCPSLQAKDFLGSLLTPRTALSPFSRIRSVWVRTARWCGVLPGPAPHLLSRALPPDSPEQPRRLSQSCGRGSSDRQSPGRRGPFV